MNRKSILLIVEVLAVVALFGIALLSISNILKKASATSQIEDASASFEQFAEASQPGSEGQSGNEDQSDTKERSNGESQSDAKGQSDAEILPASVYENGKFTFTAGEFLERFADTLPEGYFFGDSMEANVSRNDKMQVDILDENGTSVDISVLLNVKEADSSCSQMALVLKRDGFDEDAASMLDWYLTTFLKDIDPERLTEIYKDYLDMFHVQAQDYRLQSGELFDTMMSCVSEDSGDYYYVMISAQ